MIAIPLSVLAFAAGVYLLVKVKREFLGGLFEALSWLVIVLSLVSLGYSGYKTLGCCGKKCSSAQKCSVEREVIIKEMGEGGGMCHGAAKAGCSAAEGSHCQAGGCKMEGDSVVMDKAVCEGMMGKEKCDAMCKERGRCILAKDECMALCKASGKKCCAEGAGAPTCQKPAKCCKEQKTAQ
ncbi:MAG: hypothetical protein IPN22_08450 [Bacteroidetes bacterium]|nr:hypothetical protein [Bacteroidota bacterium]